MYLLINYYIKLLSICSLRNIRYIFNTVVIVALWRVLVARSDIARNLWILILNLVTKFVKFFRLTSAVKR